MEGLDQESEVDLEQLGLPISNTENKLLEAELQQKEKEATTYQIKIDEHKNRIQAITDHLKNVKKELQHTQGLLEARKKDVETEDHMRQIAEREEGRLKGELRSIDLERDDLKEKRNIYENNIFHAKTKTEELKSHMNWDQQALEAWLEESARQDDDAFIIAKYARADESKIKELSLKTEHLHDQMAKKKKLLDNEMIETMSAQIELDKTAEDFRKAHRERKEYIDQWEQTIDQMKKRDEDMDKSAHELTRLKVELMEMENLIKEKQEFLDNEKQNNAEIEKKSNGSERLAAKFRSDLQDLDAARIQIKDELETLKYSVDRTASDLESTRGQSAHLTMEIKDKRKKLETLTKQRELMQFELNKATRKTLSSEEHAHRIDQLLAEEEANVSHMEKELVHMREKQFLSAQQLFELKKKNTSMEGEQQGGKTALRNLNSKQYKLDEELLKQQEILYAQDFQLQQLLHRLSRMEGERTGEEMEMLNAKIKELEKHWERQQGEEQLIRNQLKRLQEDLRRINREIEKGLKKKLSLEDKIDELNLHIDITQRELKKAIATKQDKMVDENIIKLEVKRLRDHLYAHADEVHSLEKKKLLLDTAMSERICEIAAHKDTLNAQIRACESERQTISCELHECISKVDKLRNRYEIITVSMSPEGEEQHSQAYYVIKAAQEREELQRTGDNLDAKIRKAEKEIRAMENTLHLMNSKNASFRKSLIIPGESSDVVSQLHTLEGQLRAAQDRFKHKKTGLSQMKEDMEVVRRNLSSLTEDKSALSSTLQEKHNELASQTKQKEELKAKQDRVSLQMTKLLKELRGKTKVCGYSPAEVQRDIELRELRDFAGNVVYQLGSLGSQYPNLVATMQLMFSQAGLPPVPSPSASRGNSVASSARSTPSSVSGRSTSSRLSATPTVPLQTTTVGVGDLTMSGGSTPRTGMSPRSSTSSTGFTKPPVSKTSLTGSRKSSRSQSKSSSRASSIASKKSQKDLDLTITSFSPR